MSLSWSFLKKIFSKSVTFLSGPIPKGKSTTQSISLFDCMLLEVKSVEGTPDYYWKEKKPGSDKRTRVLGTTSLFGPQCDNIQGLIFFKFKKWGENVMIFCYFELIKSLFI